MVSGRTKKEINECFNSHSCWGFHLQRKKVFIKEKIPFLPMMLQGKKISKKGDGAVVCEKEGKSVTGEWRKKTVPETRTQFLKTATICPWYPAPAIHNPEKERRIAGSLLWVDCFATSVLCCDETEFRKD